MLRRPWRLFGRIGIVALSFVLAAVGPAGAQQQQPEQRLEFIRDAEIEHTIRTFATPIFEAAGIAPDSVEIVLIQDNNINAFVAEGMNLFLHTGLLMSSDDAGQVIGVIAHETGHIAGGHLIRSRDAIASASAEAILATILGVGAAVASGQAGAGAGVMMGGQEMARRALLSFSRTQEASADQAGLTFL